MDAADARFGGIARLYGTTGLAKLRAAHVAVIGVGGVGSWSAEALARSGIGRLTLVDLDEVCVTNTNRQIHALEGSIGRPKVTELTERISRINPDCVLQARQEFFTAQTADAILGNSFDYLIDAIDGLTSFETWDLMTTSHGRSTRQVRRNWVRAIASVLDGAS